MLIKEIGEKAMFHMFTHILTGLAKSWFQSLKLGIIASIGKLFSKFIHKFYYASHQEKFFSKLTFIKQYDTKSLAFFVNHQEALHTSALYL